MVEKSQQSSRMPALIKPRPLSKEAWAGFPYQGDRKNMDSLKKTAS